MSRTRMGAGVCIGALTRDDLRTIRLCPADGIHNHPAGAPYEIGQVWEIQYGSAASIEPPHVEDVVLDGQGHFVAMQSGMAQYLTARIHVWEGSPSALFDGGLHFTANARGYMAHDGDLSRSVGFWRPDRDLALEPGDGQRYHYTGDAAPASIKYVGTTEAASVISAGTLVRVSLSRWFSPSDGPTRCWLQLSGWYRDGN